MRSSIDVSTPGRAVAAGLLSLSALAWAPLAAASALSDVATSMQPGEWAEVATENMAATLGASGASGFIITYTEEVSWDPNSRRLLFVGGDHNDNARFATYSESSNRWQRPPQPGWLPPPTSHGYDHMAIDTARGMFYTRESYHSKNFRRFDTATDTWSNLPDNNLFGSSGRMFTNCCGAADFFPELDGLLWVQGGADGNLAGLFILRHGAGNWERLASNLQVGIAHNFMEYNPIHKVMVFGGGNDRDTTSRDMYKIDRTGTVTKLANAPINLRTQQSVFTYDPVSGKYLVFAAGRTFYTYDVTTDTWRLQNPGTMPLFGPDAQQIAATPIGTYGVTLFVKAYQRDYRVYLYKHSDSDAPIDNIAPMPAGNVTVQ